jgi:hypothetical protein
VTLISLLPLVLTKTTVCKGKGEFNSMQDASLHSVIKSSQTAHCPNDSSRNQIGGDFHSRLESPMQSRLILHFFHTWLAGSVSGYVRGISGCLGLGVDRLGFLVFRGLLLLFLGGGFCDQLLEGHVVTFFFWVALCLFFVRRVQF